MQDNVGGQNLFERGAECRHQFGWQIGYKPNGIGKNHFKPGPQLDRSHGRVQRCKEHIFGHHPGPGQTVEQSGFTGIGIAHQSHHRKGHLGPCSPVQTAGFDHFAQLPPQPHQLLIDRPPVCFDLGFAGPADKSKPTALALKVGPGPHQTRTLITQGRHFNL